MARFRPPQGYVRVAIEYYDTSEKAKLDQYSSAARLQGLAGNSLNIPSEQFLTYYLFKRKRPGVPGLRTYGELKNKIGQAYDDLRGLTKWSGENLSVPENTLPVDRSLIERIGEAVALSIVNELHGLTAADWGPIPETHEQMTLDYEIASDGIGIIQVEAKGTAKSENQVKGNGGSVYAHAKSIREKKSTSGDAFASTSVRPNERYGVITAIQIGDPQPLKAWVLDPPSLEIDRTPESIRLINRMRFLAELISFTYPRSQLSSALAMRLQAMEHLADPSVLDGVPLLARPDRVIQHAPSFWNKTRTEDESAIGRFFITEDRELFFVGFQTVILDLAVKQQFGEVLDFRFRPQSFEQSLNVVVPAGQAQKLNLAASAKERAEVTGPYLRFTLHGKLMQSAEGLVFGAVPLEIAQY